MAWSLLTAGAEWTDLVQVTVLGCITHMLVSDKTLTDLLLAASFGDCQETLVLKEMCAVPTPGNKCTPQAIGVRAKRSAF